MGKQPGTNTTTAFSENTTHDGMIISPGAAALGRQSPRPSSANVDLDRKSLVNEANFAVVNDSCGCSLI